MVTLPSTLELSYKVIKGAECFVSLSTNVVIAGGGGDKILRLTVTN
jgi:hypothetical protein